MEMKQSCNLTNKFTLKLVLQYQS